MELDFMIEDILIWTKAHFLEIEYVWKRSGEIAMTFSLCRMA